MARVDFDLILPTQRLNTFGQICELFNDNRLQYWVLPTDTSEPFVISIKLEERARALRILRESKSFVGWYLSKINTRNVMSPAVSSVDRIKENELNAVRMWEYVFASQDSGFRASEAQGVDLYFWASDDKDVYSSPVWRPNATPLSSQDIERLDSDKVPVAWSEISHLSTVKFPIDVVFTWVDGDDPTWIKERSRALGEHDSSFETERARGASRFESHDELRYALRGIEQYAPWVNCIWIVTSGHYPKWLDLNHPRIKLVAHEDIWPSKAGLPTFNSHAIETCLHRIDGLSEHFIYFNDDMFIARPISQNMFFHTNGLSKIFPSKALVDYFDNRPGEIASTTASRNARDLLLQKFGISHTQKFYHTGASLRRSLMMELERSFGASIELTRESQFRSILDVAMAGSLYLNYALIRGVGVVSSIRYEYVDPATNQGRERMLKILKSRCFDTFCINDGSSKETAKERLVTKIVIRNFLETYFPVKSSFEK